MSEETTQTQPEMSSTPKSSSFRRVGIIVVIALIIIGGGYYFIQNVLGGNAVAIVNGEKISQSQYNDHYLQTAAIFNSQGMATSTDAAKANIKTQTINDLIAQTLVLQAAAKESIKADSTTVNSSIDQVKKQFADEKTFQSELVKQGYTDASYKQTVTNQNIIQQYLGKHVNVSSATSSEADAQTLYKQALAANPKLPKLSDIRSQVDAEVVREKQQILITNFINSLKASSTIKVLMK